MDQEFPLERGVRAGEETDTSRYKSQVLHNPFRRQRPSITTSKQSSGREDGRHPLEIKGLGSYQRMERGLNFPKQKRIKVGSRLKVETKPPLYKKDEKLVIGFRKRNIPTNYVHSDRRKGRHRLGGKKVWIWRFPQRETKGRTEFNQKYSRYLFSDVPSQTLRIPGEYNQTTTGNC